MATEDPAEQEELATTSPHPEKRDPGMLLAAAAIRSLPFAVAILDCQGNLVLANNAWLRLQDDFGLRPGESNGHSSPVLDLKTFRVICPEANLIHAGIGKVIQRLLPRYASEFQIQLPPRPRWFHLQAEPLEIDGYYMLTLAETTRQHKTEQDLRESHFLFHRVVEGTGDAVFIYDTQGRFLMHNSACADLFSQHRGKLTGKAIHEVFPPEVAQTIHNQNELVLGTGRTLGYEIVLKHPDGDRTLLIQKGVYRNHHNEVAGIIGISRDITERKLAEEKLERSERHFRALIEKSNDCVGILSAAGDILYVSPQAKRLFGFELEHWIGSNAFFWIHPDEVKMAREQMDNVLRSSAASLTTEVRVLCKDGNWKWVELTASNLMDDPNVQAVIINLHDISERKQAEHDLQRFQAIVECSIDAIFSIDPTGIVTSWNPAAARIFGYTEEEMIGKDVHRLIPTDRLGESRRFASSVLRGKAIRDEETVRLAKNQRRIDVSLTLSPIYGSSRNITGAAVIVRDITERRRLEKEVLEISDFEKHRIGQDLHDDLCQHLVGITMVSSRLQKDLQQYGIKQAEDAGQITDMLRNAVDHTRMLARGLSPLDFSNGGLIAGLQGLVTNTERLFRIPCHFECDSPVQVDDHEVATHLFRIAQEALHNAVKHSKGTRVVVRLQRCEKELLEISVDDDGVGLPETLKPSNCGSGLGMHTMRYRARIIGAMLFTLRNPEGGSRVMCRFRLPEQQALLQTGGK